MSNIIDVRVTPGGAPKAMPALVADELCLNFINTRSGRHTAEEREFLGTGRDVVDFFVHAGRLSAQDAAALKNQVEARKGAFTRLQKRAVEIREIMAAIFLAVSSGGKPAMEDVSALDATWRDFAAEGELVLADGGFERRWTADASPAAFLLGPVAESFFELMSESKTTRMKSCPADDCHFVFYDRSKNNSRVWCDMAVCGNRAKVRRFNSRKRARAAG